MTCLAINKSCNIFKRCPLLILYFSFVVFHVCLGGSISLLWLLGVDREEDQLGLVLLQALSVLSEAVLRLVAAAVVHGDADGAGIVGVDASDLYTMCEWGV